MSPQQIFDGAPLGAAIRFTDGASRPPDRFRRKLSAWKDRNDSGRLVEKSAFRDTSGLLQTFTLHLATYGSNGTIVLVVHRGFSMASALDFEIVDRPRRGMVRVLTSVQDSTALRHLAPDMAAACARPGAHHQHEARRELVDDEHAIGGRAI